MVYVQILSSRVECRLNHTGRPQTCFAWLGWSFLPLETVGKGFAGEKRPEPVPYRLTPQGQPGERAFLPSGTTELHPHHVYSMFSVCSKCSVYIYILYTRGYEYNYLRNIFVQIPRVSRTLSKNGVTTLNNGVMDLFLKGHGDSRYIAASFVGYAAHSYTNLIACARMRANFSWAGESAKVQRVGKPRKTFP